MRLNKDLVIIHAYLCADGYVTRNSSTQKHTYHHIGFRNTNSILLKDFQERFAKVFEQKSYLIENQRCRVGSKKIYKALTGEFGSFYSWKWQMPELDKNYSRGWLRAYFDCEGWVFCKKGQNRHIGVDCVNKKRNQSDRKIIK